MAQTLDNEIQKYLPLLGKAEKKSLLGVIKSFLSLKEEASGTLGLADSAKEMNEIEFDKEMRRRIDDYEQGRIKTYTHDELVAHARNSFAVYQKSAK